MSAYFDIAQFNLVPLGAAVLIGIAIARWMFRRPPAPAQSSEDQPES